MAGGLQVVGLLALLIGACEFFCRLFPRRLVDEFADAFGDVPAPRDEAEVRRLRERGL